MNKIDPLHFTKGRKVNLCIRMPEDLKKALAKIAEERGYGFCDFIRIGLDQWAKAHEMENEIRHP